MISKQIDEITEPDLQELVDNSVLERKNLEYKQSLPGNTDADKKEFLADVSSFANAFGGDIFYGIVSDNTTGFPQKVEGINISNVDQEITRLDNSIRDGIEPRIPGVDIQSISLANSKVVLIIRVQKSWNMPHRVTYKGHDKFYSRSTNGKYPLDVNELRDAFNFSTSMAEKIRNFKAERIAKILSDDTPIPLCPTPKTVLHIIPVNAFNPAQSYDFSEIIKSSENLKPISANDNWTKRYNIDGLLTYTTIIEAKSGSYLQIFKNGIIEAVEATILGPFEGKRLIYVDDLENELINAFTNYLLALKKLHISLPAYVFLSILSVRGYVIVTRQLQRITRIHEIDRDHLFLLESILEGYNIESSTFLRPYFDSIWNACGFLRSFNYNDKGDRLLPKTN